MGAALEGALCGRGKLLLVLGEAGIGKTRLADEIAARAAARGAPAFWGRCWEAGGAPEYWPWIQVLRPLVCELGPKAFATEPSERVLQMSRLLPDFRAAGSASAESPSVTSASEVERFQLFDAVTATVKKAASVRPLVLVLDDLHAADPSSLLLMRFLARDLRGTRILLVGTFRDAEARRDRERARLLDELAREGEVLALGALGRSDVERLVERQLGKSPPPGVVDEVYRLSEGVPFFVDEALQILPSLKGGAAPARLSGLTRGRLELLSRDCRRLLAAASVIGREFDLGDLRQVTDLAAEILLDLLGEALAANVIRRPARDTALFGFSHALLREALYAELAPAERSRLHGKVAAALERRYGANPDSRLAELAHHFFEASRLGGDPGQAAEYSRRAGDRARSLFAFEEAASHYERALQAVELRAPADEGGRCELLLGLGQARLQAGDAERARSAFLEAADRARRLSDPERFGRAAICLAGRSDVSVETDRRTIALLEEALEQLRGDETELRVRLLGRLAIALYYTTSRERMEPLTAEAVALARRIGDPATLGFALHARHFTIWGPGNLDEKRRLATEVIELAHGVGSNEQEIGGQFWRFVDSLEAGDPESTTDALEAYDRLARDLKQAFYSWRAATQRATLAILAGCFREAERLVEEALEIGQVMTSPSPGVIAGAQISWLRREQGRFEELEAPLRALAEMQGAIPAFRIGLAHLLCELGREGEARAELDRLARCDFRDLPRDSSWLTCLQGLTQVCAALGDKRCAGKLYDLLAPYGRQVIVAGFGEICQGSVAHCLGLLAHVLGRREQALRHFECALEVHARIGARPFLARTKYELARLLLGGSVSDGERAAGFLVEAAKLADDIGMKELSGRIEELESQAASAARSRENLLRLEGSFWTLVYEGRLVRVKDAKGLRYLAHLLANPEVDFLALELTGVGDEAEPATPRPGRREILESGLDRDARELLDGRAKDEYRRRLEDLGEELEEAEAFNDIGRAERIRAEIDALTRALAAAVGLRGRDRKADSAVERARVAVTKAIREAVARLDEAHPSLAEHLRESLRTGRSFCYAPCSPSQWIVER